ncbi:hypothetical protein BDV11DRAFT_193639 [Aspergillus similis]
MPIEALDRVRRIVPWGYSQEEGYPSPMCFIAVFFAISVAIAWLVHYSDVESESQRN